MEKVIRIYLIIISLIVVFFILGIFIFRPVPIVEEKDAITVTGIVVGVFEGGVNDVFFKLRGDNVRYYVNRGTELGLNVDSLKRKLVGNQVVFKYPDYWTPLDWNNKIRHLSKVEFNNEVLFNELRGSKQMKQ